MEVAIKFWNSSRFGYSITIFEEMVLPLWNRGKSAYFAANSKI